MKESDRVFFGPPSDRAWLPPKARNPIEAAFDEGQVRIYNGTAPRDHAVWEILQRWADALLGIYLVSIGLPGDSWSNAPTNDSRYALLEPETITKNISRRVLELAAEYNLRADDCDLESLSDNYVHGSSTAAGFAVSI